MTALKHVVDGQRAHAFNLTDLNGKRHSLEDYQGTHLLLSLYRSPDCALCSLRLYQLGLVYPRLHAAGLSVLAVFEAKAETIQRLTQRHPPPFPLVADPDRHMFERYDVRASWWGLRGTLRLRSVWQALKYHVTGTLTTGRTHQLPADILIGPDGRIKVAYYGKDTGDHLSIDSIEALLQPTAPVHAERPL